MTDTPQPHSRTRASHTEAAPEAQEADEVDQGPAQPPFEPYVDPYKQVFSPWELPANTAAAQAIAAVVTVDPEVPISAERQAQAEAAIQEHQDNVQDVVASISDDPRLSGATFAEHAAKQAEDSAARALAKES